MVILSVSVLGIMSRNLGSKVPTTYDVHMFHMSVSVVKIVFMSRMVTDSTLLSRRYVVHTTNKKKIFNNK